jgi:hypothetical protein
VLCGAVSVSGELQGTILHEMTIEEARNTEVNITRTERGRYGNAHIRYDINDAV